MKRRRYQVTIVTTIIVESPSEAWVNEWLESRDTRAAGGIWRDAVPYHTEAESEEENYSEIGELPGHKGKAGKLDANAKRRTETMVGVSLTDEEFAEEDPGIFGEIVAGRQDYGEDECACLICSDDTSNICSGDPADE